MKLLVKHFFGFSLAAAFAAMCVLTVTFYNKVNEDPVVQQVTKEAMEWKASQNLN